MGTMVKIYCKNCGNPCLDEYLGVGMMFFPDNVFNKCIEEDPIIYHEITEKQIKADVKKLLADGATPGEDYGREIYYCKHCKSIHAKFHFSLEKDGNIYTPHYECQLCNGELERTENDDNVYEDEASIIGKLEIVCKECGGTDFVYDEYGCWD